MPVRDTICYVYQTLICILWMLSNLPALLAFCTTIKSTFVETGQWCVCVFTHYYYYYDISERKRQLRLSLESEKERRKMSTYIYVHETHLLHKIFFTNKFSITCFSSSFPIFFFYYFEWHNRDEKRASNSFLKSMQLWTIIFDYFASTYAQHKRWKKWGKEFKFQHKRRTCRWNNKHMLLLSMLLK